MNHFPHHPMASARGPAPTVTAPDRRRQTFANDNRERFPDDEGMSLWFEELRDRLRLWSAYGCVWLTVFLMLYFAAQELRGPAAYVWSFL